MKTLSLIEMEDVQGGLNACQKSALRLAGYFAGAFFIGGPLAAGIFAARFIYGSIRVAQNCRGY